MTGPCDIIFQAHDPARHPAEPKVAVVVAGLVSRALAAGQETRP